MTTTAYPLRRLEASCSDPGTKGRPQSAATVQRSHILHEEQDIILAALKTSTPAGEGHADSDHGLTDGQQESVFAADNLGQQSPPDRSSRHHRRWTSGTSAATASSAAVVAATGAPADAWETDDDNHDNNACNNNNHIRSRGRRASCSAGGVDDESSPDSTRRSSSSSRQTTGPASLSEEDDISSSSLLQLPETIRHSMGRLKDLAHEIELLNSDLSAIVHEGHQILDWGTVDSSRLTDEDDNTMSSLSRRCTEGKSNHNRHRQHQQLMVQRRLGVLDRCARTGVEQASQAYLAYISTVHHLNLTIELEVREYISTVHHLNLTVDLEVREYTLVLYTTSTSP